MSYLADTNVVCRRVLSGDPLHIFVRAALERLSDQGEIVYGCPQNLLEFHALATRPAAASGLGLPSPEARRQAQAIETSFRCSRICPRYTPNGAA